MADSLWRGQLFPEGLIKVAQGLGAHFCDSNSTELNQWACGNLLYLISGFAKEDAVKLAPSTVHRISAMSPGITSIRCLTHYLQSIKCKNFGTKYKVPFLRSLSSTSQKNKAEERARSFFQLHRLRPECHTRQYKLSNTNVPIMMFFGTLDNLVVPQASLLIDFYCDYLVFLRGLCINCTLFFQDAIRTISGTASFKNDHVKIITVEKYQHIDFVYAESARELIYQPAMKYLKRDCSA